jgi:hypothetical protein
MNCKKMGDLGNNDAETSKNTRRAKTGAPPGCSRQRAAQNLVGRIGPTDLNA